MSTVNNAYGAIAKLNLWFKVRTGDTYVLSDFPEIVTLRWAHIRDNWEFLKKSLLDLVPSYSDPGFLNQQINDFSRFIEFQRTASKKINPFSDGTIFHKYYSIFDNIAVENIQLTSDEESIISNGIEEVRRYSKNDFLLIKSELNSYRNRYTDTVNLSDEDYNKAFNKSSIAGQVKATITDINLINTIQQGIKSVDFILANLFAVDAFVDPFALARANANNPEIDIGLYSSGRLVKLHYGESLQELASRYFEDPNRWIDIAIANGLKPPYIDEVGEKLPLLANGEGNQLNIGEKDINGTLNIDKFYINQVVLLQSDVQIFSEQRTIVNIRQVPVSGEIVLELDGGDDLDKYKVSEGAHIRVYKPNTINSSFFILIPSEEPLSDIRKDEVPWFLAKNPESERRAKIDIAIDDNGEINFDTNGDIKLSYGLSNAVQAIKLKMVTELGSLKYHPDYGLVNIMGNKNNDLDSVKSLLTESIISQVEADTRFDRVQNISIDYITTGAANSAVSAVFIGLEVKLAGSDQVIPISFTVNY
jgi:hypothetical protein